MAPGWRTGWLAVGRNPRLDDVVQAMRKLADARLCSTVPMEHAIKAALTGDRSHQVTFRAALKERAAITTTSLNAVTGMTCVAPTAAFYAFPRVSLPQGRTDEDYVIALLRATGVLCVHGSGFGMAPADGYFRVVFLAAPDELRDVYRLMADFTANYLRS
jgi:aspartate/methionine/tyrosine aminotransferase